MHLDSLFSHEPGNMSKEEERQALILLIRQHPTANTGVLMLPADYKFHKEILDEARKFGATINAPDSQGTIRITLDLTRYKTAAQTKSNK